MWLEFRLCLGWAVLKGKRGHSFPSWPWFSLTAHCSSSCRDPRPLARFLITCGMVAGEEGLSPNRRWCSNDSVSELWPPQKFLGGQLLFLPAPDFHGCSLFFPLNSWFLWTISVSLELGAKQKAEMRNYRQRRSAFLKAGEHLVCLSFERTVNKDAGHIHLPPLLSSPYKNHGEISLLSLLWGHSVSWKEIPRRVESPKECRPSELTSFLRHSNTSLSEWNDQCHCYVSPVTCSIQATLPRLSGYTCLQTWDSHLHYNLIFWCVWVTLLRFSLPSFFLW